MKREFLILGKEKCYFTDKIIKYLEDHEDEFSKKVYYVNIDFQEREFRDKFGTTSTYPRVYLIKKNGKMDYLGGADNTISILEKQFST